MAAQTPTKPPRVTMVNGAFRVITENGCVTGLTRAEAMTKHAQRMASRKAKGWPLTGVKP